MAVTFLHNENAYLLALSSFPFFEIATLHKQSAGTTKMLRSLLTEQFAEGTALHTASRMR